MCLNTLCHHHQADHNTLPAIQLHAALDLMTQHGVPVLTAPAFDASQRRNHLLQCLPRKRGLARALISGGPCKH